MSVCVYIYIYIYIVAYISMKHDISTGSASHAHDLLDHIRRSSHENGVDQDIFDFEMFVGAVVRRIYEAIQLYVCMYVCVYIM